MTLLVRLRRIRRGGGLCICYCIHARATWRLDEDTRVSVLVSVI